MVHQLPLRRCPGHGVREGRNRGVDHLRQGSSHPRPQFAPARSGGGSKKNAAPSLKERLQSSLSACSRKATSTLGSAQRLTRHLLASLLCPDRLTLSNVICTSGGQHQDWTADYRLYSKNRFVEERLFAPVIEAAEHRIPKGRSLVVLLDDTLVRKTGPRINGVSWKRDPLSPPFQTNLVRGQRYIQFSAAWALDAGSPGQPPIGPARALPISFHHAPGAGRLPAKLEAEPQAKAEHRLQCKQKSLTIQALGHFRNLRNTVPPDRSIHLIGDGSYTNVTIVKALPENTCYTGRFRKDAVLHHPPPPLTADHKGRRPSYGPQAPTPDALRADESVPWQTVTAHAAGKKHEFKVKVLEKVLWRKCGAQQLFRIIVIAPLGYRLRKGSKMLYRQPAYLLSTAHQLSVAEALQAYLWRWGIEVNFRDEKSLIGTGQAQVRGESANQLLPASTVAAYSHLWLSALRAGDSCAGAATHPLTPPKWRQKPKTTQPALPSTGELLRLLRSEYWREALRPSHYYHFATRQPRDTNSEKFTPDLPAVALALAG